MHHLVHCLQSRVSVAQSDVGNFYSLLQCLGTHDFSGEISRKGRYKITAKVNWPSKNNNVAAGIH